MKFVFKIFTLYRLIISWTYSIYLKNRFNATLGQKVFFNKLPNIYITKDCVLTLGDNVLINSNNKRYHINMHSNCKIILDRPGAEIVIGSNSRIHGTCIHAYKSIRIGKNCLIAANTQIFDGNGHDVSLSNPSNRINTIGNAKPIIIEDNVWIGANSIILPGVTLGEGCVVSAGSIVVKDVPPRCIVAGNPALPIIKNNN